MMRLRGYKGKSTLAAIAGMYLFYLLWGALDSIYMSYIYPNKVQYLITANLYKALPGLLTCSSFIIMQKWIWTRYSSRKSQLLIFSFSAAAICTFIDSCITSTITTYSFMNVIIFDFSLVLSTLEVWGLFFFAAGAFFYFISFQKKSAEQELQLETAKSLANEARLMMLRYQINPHFLFNTLNTIQSVIQTDQEKAKVMIGELSEFFRYTLSKNDQNSVSLIEEVNSVKNYLFIQKVRFGDNLSITYNIDDTLNDIKVPFFILHPLVENAVKYGLSSGKGKMTLLIEAKKEINGTRLLIRNSGYLIEKSNYKVPDQISTKTGIANLKKRLTLLYPGSHEFSLIEEDGHVNAIIMLIKNGDER